MMFVAVTAAVVAVVTITSNTVELETVEKPTLTLTCDVEENFLGEPVTFTAHLSTGVSNVEVNFFLDAMNIGHALTDSNGDAELVYTPEAVGTYGYYAECVIG